MLLGNFRTHEPKPSCFLSLDTDKRRVEAPLLCLTKTEAQEEKEKRET
jgi:hypothetical protein